MPVRASLRVIPLLFEDTADRAERKAGVPESECALDRYDLVLIKAFGRVDMPDAAFKARHFSFPDLAQHSAALRA